MPVELDLIADLNAEDDDGLGWSTLADASQPKRVVPGAMLLAGNRYGQAVVRIGPPRLEQQPGVIRDTGREVGIDLGL